MSEQSSTEPVRLPVPAGAGMHGAVVEWLGSAMASGHLQGVIDPDRLAAELQVSRSLVRECLRTIAAKGMVTAKRRTGTVVTPVDTWALMDDQVIRWRASGPERFDQMREALVVRTALEPLAASLCAEHRAPDSLERLYRAVDDIRAASESDDLALLLKADETFHRELYHGSGNRIMARLSGPVVACLWIPDLRVYPMFSDNVVTRHQELADLIAAGDADAVRSEVEHQLKQTEILWRQAALTLSSPS